MTKKDESDTHEPMRKSPRLKTKPPPTPIPEETTKVPEAAARPTGTTAKHPQPHKIKKEPSGAKPEKRDILKGTVEDVLIKKHKWELPISAIDVFSASANTEGIVEDPTTKQRPKVERPIIPRKGTYSSVNSVKYGFDIGDIVYFYGTSDTLKTGTVGVVYQIGDKIQETPDSTEEVGGQKEIPEYAEEVGGSACILMIASDDNPRNNPGIKECKVTAPSFEFLNLSSVGSELAPDAISLLQPYHPSMNDGKLMEVHMPGFVGLTMFEKGIVATRMLNIYESMENVAYMHRVGAWRLACLLNRGNTSLLTGKETVRQIDTYLNPGPWKEFDHPVLHRKYTKFICTWGMKYQTYWHTRELKGTMPVDLDSRIAEHARYRILAGMNHNKSVAAYEAEIAETQRKPTPSTPKRAKKKSRKETTPTSPDHSVDLAPMLEIATKNPETRERLRQWAMQEWATEELFTSKLGDTNLPATERSSPESTKKRRLDQTEDVTDSEPEVTEMEEDDDGDTKPPARKETTPVEEDPGAV